VDDIISDPDKISADWLQEVLHGSGVLKGAGIRSLQWEIIGTGKMGDNARFTIAYDRPCAAPATIIAKLSAADETARTMAAYTGAYRKEVMFYRELAGLSEIDTPAVYCARIDASGTDFIILMEDLAPAQPGDQLLGESVDRARRALAEAAKLHSAFQDQSAVLAADYITHNDAQGAAFGQDLMQQNWPGFVDRFGHGLDARSIRFGEQYLDHHAAWVCRYAGPRTLIHGDFRSENVLFNANGRTTTVDWQTLSESCGLADVAYFIGGSLDIETRRQCERDLLQHYRQSLAACGVELDAQACWQQYREFSMHGIMITVLGAMFTQADARGDRMFLAMAQRHLQQCVDLDAAEFLN
jgi:aminoglycoside phosphotransferase (APT) family kinase protein